jgi:hypothetical protein
LDLLGVTVSGELPVNNNAALQAATIAKVAYAKPRLRFFFLTIEA